MLVLIDETRGLKKRMEGGDCGKMFGAHGRDELNNNGERLLMCAKEHKLALTNIF